MNKKESILGEIIKERGIQILNTPSKVRETIARRNAELEVFGIQLEMFLKATNMGKLLQTEESLMKIGRAGYESMILRAAKETGFTVESVERIGETLLRAAGYTKMNIYHYRLPENLKLPIINQAKGDIGGTARGEEAYKCAKIWIFGKVIVLSADKKSVWRSSSSKEAVLGFQYAKRAADDGFLEANGLVGLCYYYGIGVEADEETALKYLLKNGVFRNRDFLPEIKEVLNHLLYQKEERKKRKVYTTGLSAFVFLCLLLAGILVKDVGVPVLWILLAAANTGAAVFFLLIQNGTERMRNIFAGSSAVIWIGFLLQICW